MVGQLLREPPIGAGPSALRPGGVRARLDAGRGRCRRPVDDDRRCGAGSISVERSTVSPGISWKATATPRDQLDVRPFHRTLDSRWRRASYTSITSSVPEAGVSSEPEDAGIADEQPAARTDAGLF